MHSTPSSLWDKFYQAVEPNASIKKYPDDLGVEAAIWKRMHPYAHDDPPWSENKDDA